MIVVHMLLPYRFELDYVCAACGRRFALDEHDFAACAESTRSTGDSIYAADAVRAQSVEMDAQFLEY